MSCGFSWGVLVTALLVVGGAGLELELVQAGGHTGEVVAGWLEHQALLNLLPVCWDWEQASLCFPFKSRVSNSHSSLALLVISLAVFQNQQGELVFPVPNLRTGVPNVGLELLAP